MKKIMLPGSEDYWNGYEFGELLAERFPNEAPEDLGYALTYHGAPLKDEEILSVEMIREGYNDGPSWFWEITFSNRQVFILEGWCDYTGWDCQSGTTWFKAL